MFFLLIYKTIFAENLIIFTYEKIVALSALLSLTLVSCGDDDKPQPEPPKDNTTTLLLGKWNMVTGEVYENGELVQSGSLVLKAVSTIISK